MSERLGDGGGGPSRDDGRPRRSTDGPSSGRSDNGPSGGRRRWLLHLYDVVTSAGGVLLVGLLIVAVSGVWPPLVAIESGSMEPHIQEGDLVFVMEEERFAGPGAHADTGVVTAANATLHDYRTFQGPGDVIVFQPGGDPSETPIIHRAMFWVEEGEDWSDRADGEFLRGADCSELEHCEAPHAGFVTKGDHNDVYDQVDGDDANAPVKPEWVLGTAEYRVPYVGQLRLGAREVLGAHAKRGPRAVGLGGESAVEPRGTASAVGLATNASVVSP